MTGELSEQIHNLTTWVERLEAEIENGATADLKGLDSEVQRVCDAVAAQRDNVDDEVRVSLARLLETIDRLQTMTRDHFEGVRAELQSHGRRSQAARAYTQGMGNKPGKGT